MKTKTITIICMFMVCTYLTAQPEQLMAATAAEYEAVPPYVTSKEAPLVMLVMGRNHKLYYEAYNDASDLDEDGGLDVGYKGEDEVFVDSNGNGVWDSEESYTDENSSGTYDSGEPFVDTNSNGTWDAGEALTDINGDGKWNAHIDYYGYFDSYKCYEYDATSSTFIPTSAPVDVGGDPTKKCGGANEWSGDFLNYLTMSRMDTIRKVLYGGYRSTDSSTETVLERVFIPQDAHSWGKEYESVERDGFDISEYTPLDLPETGTRHLFASTTLGNNDPPILRVLPNNTHRIWEWVAKERPVCDNSLEEVAGGGSTFTGYIADHADFVQKLIDYANPTYLQGVREVAAVDQNSGSNKNPKMADPDNYYISVLTANLLISDQSGYTNIFKFGIDGDDAVEVVIEGVTGQGLPDDEFVYGWYGGHGWWGNYNHNADVTLAAGTYPIAFNFHEAGGNEAWKLAYQRKKLDGSWSSWYLVKRFEDGGGNPTSTNMLVEDNWTQTFYSLSDPATGSVITDYEVRVKVCDPALLEDNCKEYPDGSYRPTGLLQQYGESNRMYFGLLTGSYGKNLDGGVLRKNIGTITDEIDRDSGRFKKNMTGYLAPTGTDGEIVNTIDKLRIVGFDYSSHSYSSNCGWITTTSLADAGTGKCVMWGNPTGEMMYESLRYFTGKKSPVAAFDYLAGGADDDLDLPKPDWQDPYEEYNYCAKPFMLVLSDIYPTYDSNQIPGNTFNTTVTGDISSPALDADALADTIFGQESELAGDHFIGQNASKNDGACSSKTVSDLGEIRGLCPEEPTKRGSYYAASVAYYGAKNDVSSTAQGAQHISTYSVTLASPLPRINIDIRGHAVTLVPFAKSVGGCLGINGTEGVFQPTNTIVDFFVEEITATHGVFRINYEDVEQGADHDMDAIVEYDYQVNADDSLDITLRSTYAAGCIQQHIGYIISGTTADGTYLEVRDSDTDAGADPDYFLDTPPGVNPGGDYADGNALPLETTRRFTPGSDPSATLMTDPLWYAAKWGGFIDENTATEDTNGNEMLDVGEDLNANNAIDYLTDPKPDLQAEWDEDGDGTPDSYFYVINPLRLEEQLSKSFDAILNRVSSGTAASVISSSREGEGAVYQSIFYPKIGDEYHNAVYWAGELHALFVDDYGNMREDTNNNFQINLNDEDLNGNGFLDSNISEDVNNNGILDVGEDLNGNNHLDLSLDEDLDDDGILDDRDYIIFFDGSDIYKYDDANENGVADREDYTTFSPDIPGWHGNGTLDTEDTNSNGILDSGEDKNGNNKLDTEDLNGNGTLDTELISGPHPIDDINYLWNSNNWLNGVGFDALTQRAYSQTTSQRYLFTFLDADNDMLVDASEQVSFEYSEPASDAELTDASKIYPYLTLYPSFLDEPTWVTEIQSDGNDTVFRKLQSERVINYIRGIDQGEARVGARTVPAMRSREYYDGGTKTWRLGDIVHSSPTVVIRPAESYNLLYKDQSYSKFAAKYEQRRAVIYTGGNDGIIHAFNGGFFDSSTNTFVKSLAEPFTDIDGDGHWDPGDTCVNDIDGDGRCETGDGEPYTDADGDGHYDMDEPFTDTDGDGHFDEENEPFTDTDGDGHYDPGGEPFIDADGDGKYDLAEDYTDDDLDGHYDSPESYSDMNGNGSYDIAEDFNDIDGDGHYDWEEPYTDVDGDSNYDAVDEGYTDTDGDGHYDKEEPWWDTDFDGIYDPVEDYTDTDGDGHYDEEEPYTDVDGDGIYDIVEDYGDTDSDGHYDEEEPYTDVNGNGSYDATEPYVDTDGDGHWDAAEPFVDNDSDGIYNYTAEPYTDSDSDGHWDDTEPFVDNDGDGHWDAAEPYTDLDGDGQRSTAEPFTDSDGDGFWNDAEPYTDSDGDGHWDKGEPFTDSDGDGHWDAEESYTDVNSDGNFDGDTEPYLDSDGDGHYDVAEPYIDSDGDGKYDYAEQYIDKNGNGQYDGQETFNDLNSNGVWDSGEPFVDIDGDGHYDPGEDTFADNDGDGRYDEAAEPFVDWNNNGIYDGATQTAWELGAEMWGYVPYNLLPHLYWLTEEGYPHVYYNDLKPRVFDAKIFFKADGTQLDDDHPEGWGTVMVVGMRLGGGEIVADMNNNDVVDNDDRTMRSAYVIFDITNPEAEPKVLAEISFNNMGFTTCYPGVIPMQSKTGSGALISFTSNDWYLVFGSGPADSSGAPAGGLSVDTPLQTATSKQTGKLFVVDLKELVDPISPKVMAVDTSGALTDVEPFWIQEFEADSFVSQPSTVDFNLDFNADAVYFGTNSGDDATGWKGRLRRLIVNNETDTLNWVDQISGVDRADNFLINLDTVESGQAITAAPAVTVGGLTLADSDDDGDTDKFDRKRWIYFGTGRYYVRSDAENSDQQTFYGIKEPMDTNKKFTWGSVTVGELFNVTDIEVTGDKNVEDTAGTSPLLPNPTTWGSFLGQLETYGGWFHKFATTRERNISQGAILGELLTFSSYIPSADLCEFEGESWLYALYYKTGTAYYKPVIGYSWTDDDLDGVVDKSEETELKKVELGQGVAGSPSIHVGSEEGSRAFVQSSTGSILTIDQVNPGMTKSGKTSWRNR